MLFDDFVITEDKFLQPSYRISPFKTENIASNSNLCISDKIDLYFNDRFDERKYIYTKSGRNAINKALCQLNLSNDDIVTIFTTSNNLYISGCVTKEIEKYCNWSRQIEENTKAIFVNHEFGFPYEDLMSLKNYNLPIIEDCAHSFLSNNRENSVGMVGDYVVYSLPKFFPIQFGGILVSNVNEKLERDISEMEELYIKKVLSFHVDNLDDIRLRRISNYKYLEDRLSELGFKARFNLEDYHCPGVYLFRAENTDLNKMKIFLQDHGIECSVFYGEESFFIPVSQSLDYEDLDYFITLIKYYSSIGEE